MDTQWPRWEVFKRDNEKKPYQAVGSVHAVDADHALLNARNVFVRRPRAVGLWVVPAKMVFSMTLEELTENPDWAEQAETAVSDTPIPFELFCKRSHRRAMTFMDHVGQLQADSPPAALQKALTQFADQEALAWWVVPTDAIVRSGAEDVDAWFAPALQKIYKQQSQYGFVRPQSEAEGA